MHSLKPDESKVSRNCFSIATPIYNGNEPSATKSASHKCRILCNGNTSKILNQTNYKTRYKQDINMKIY